MKTRILLCLFTALLAACTNNVDSNAATADTKEDTVLEAEPDADLTRVQQAFSGVFAYLKKQDSTFAEENFLPSGTAGVEPAPAAPLDETELKPFQKYLVYNSDSSRALDLYSYNYIVVSRAGKSNLEEGSPDAEAAVINVGAKTRRRIFFGGPSFALWDGKWIDTDKLLLIGAETGADAKMTPAIWQINLSDTVMNVYQYQGHVQADMSGYQKSKFGMGF